ncbi:sulfonylurea receptor [Cochliomyia hominivorax]
MGLTIYCENVKAETIYEQLGTDICSVTTVKWEASVMAATVLMLLIFYMLWKFKYRCHKTLLTFHNLRAAVALLLLSINTIELAKALLPLPSNINDAGGGAGGGGGGNVAVDSNSGNNGYEKIYQGNGSESNLPHHRQQQQQQHEQQQSQTFIDTEPDFIVVVIGFASLANALAALILTIMLICYHRLVELKKSIGFLYISSTLSVLIFILRIYELAEIVYYDSITTLESVIQASSALCLLLLATIDGFTVYKERYRPDYLEDYDKIGYRHTLATFYSKACFWWLTPLLWFGYKEPLELEDLGQMRVEDSARAHYDRFLLIYKTDKVKNSNKTPSLWMCYLKSSWRMFTLGGLLKLFGDLFAVIGPLAIQQIVQYIENMYNLQYSNSSNNNNNINNISNALLQMNTTKSNITNSNNISKSNNNTSITIPEIVSTTASTTTTTAAATSLLRAAIAAATTMSLEQNEQNLIRNIRSPFNIRETIVKTVAAATGSTIWLPNLNDTSSSGNSNTTTNVFNSNNNNNNSSSSSNSFENYSYEYNEFGNDIDYIDTTSFTPSTGSLYSSAYTNLYSSGSEVKIFYPSWFDLLSNGWAIAWIVLLAALAQGALSQASTHILNMTGIRIKTSLQGLIYRKTLLLNSACIGGARNESSSGGGSDDAADETTTTNVYTSIDANTNTNTDTNAQNDGNITILPVTGNKIEQSVNSNCHKNMNTNNNDNSNNNHHKEYNYVKDKKMSTSPQSIEKDLIQDNSLSDIGAITNLMSEDTLNIMSFFWIAHYVWAIPLKIGIVMYLLYLKLGISAVIGSFVCILTMTPLQFLIGKAMSQNAEVMAKFTDNRLRKLHDCFVGIKLIKLNAWDNVFIRKITEARKQELKYLNKDSFYWTLMTILTHISSVLITFVTLAVYVYRESGSDITASRLFSALALFQQLTVPLLIFPITVPIILSAVVSTKRLETFLAANEIQKQFEGIRNMARILSKSDASLDMYEVKDKSQSLPSNITLESASSNEQIKLNKLNEKPKIKIVIPDKPAPLANSEPHTPLVTCDPKEPIRFADDHKKLSLHARKELLRNTPYVVIRPKKLNMTGLAQAPAPAVNTNSINTHRKTDSWHRDSLLLKMPDDIAVSVKDCKFSWNPQKLMQILYIKDIVIPRGKLTMIVGKNGSGKSSLLSALLMEMPLISGDMIWNKTSTIAYVPQQPWLLNASIRENILFGESFRPRRYDFVLEACALKPDIELMPAGDLTVIGERGINLSGGQRQRVAIARALYSSANVVIMDDPLSSLDNEVARHIFEQSIKKMLLKANRTVILVTQQLNLLQQAHNLIVLKDGCLQASGSYKDIEVTHPHIIAKWNSIIAKANAKEQQNISQENAALGRTARERWKLFKNVAKLGLQRSASIKAAGIASSGVGIGVAGNNMITSASSANHNEVDAEMEMKTSSMENILAVDDDEDDAYNAIMPVRSSISSHNTSFKLKRTPSAVYGSRHLIYDVPLPLDECQTENVILRRRRRTSSRSDSQQKARPSSRTSSRLSNISNTPTELRRSLLTNSCSSANSYMTNLSSSYGDETPASRTQSWQPFGNTTNKQHQPVARNISSPPCFDEQQVKEEDERDSDAALVADLVKTASSNNGFQQFLRRMSMRKSFKPKGVVTSGHSRKLHGNTAGSILSISEESGIAGCSAASVPSIELSSVAATDTETETESWIAGIENEESIQDTNIDYKMLLAKNVNNFAKTDADIVATTHKQSCNTTTDTSAITTVTTNLTQTSTKTPATTPATTTTTTTTTSYDVERKYGKIPSEIYLLYLRASGLTIVLIFFITALIWQTLRVYTDVWLQQWTDDNIQTTAIALAVAAATATSTKNISAIKEHKHEQSEQQMRQKYASSTTTQTSAFTFASPSFGATISENVEHHEVTYYFHIYAVISCVCIVMAMLSTPAGQWAGCKARQNLHDQLLQSIMHKSLHFFQITPLGRIMNRFSNDMAIIDKKIAATSQRLLQFTLLCLCAILINVIITPWFMVVTVPVCLAYYAIQKFYRCSSRELQRIENATNTPVISHLSETIQGVTTIRAYNQESRFTEILFRRLEENTIAFTILNTSNRWLGISLDYLGGVIVFVAIVTALLAATISCNNYNNQIEEQQKQQQEHMLSDTMASVSTTLLPLTPTPSLVGLAINYTLLMPIYLNWVVKLLADMEMYIGSVERVAYYTEPKERQEDLEEHHGDDADNKKEKKLKETDENGHNNENDDNDVNDVSCVSNNNSKECTIKQQQRPQDELKEVEDICPKSKSFSSVEKNDEKCLNLSQNNKTSDNNVDTNNVATSSTIVAKDNDTQQQQQQQKQQLQKFTNDGHIAATTTKTFKQQEKTTASEIEIEATKCDEKNDRNTIARATSTAAAAVRTIKKKKKKSSTASNTNTSLKPLERNDAERRASVRHLAKCKKQYKPVAISWPQRGDISFENVSLRYEGQTEDVIKNLNLTIPAGQRIGICGRTGSGKSSLALSLFGVLQITNGCIRIDDNDIATIHPDEIRTRLSIIPQDVHLFSMTVRENLDPSGYYSDLELWNCLELAQLKEFVNTKMPQGLDTEIQDGGLNLSVGHRQLFCLARAILRGSVCLVLDEATSALDSSTEKALLSAAHKAFQGRTIITIAHRLSTIMDYDRVIVMDQGKIIEDGSPQELKQKPDSIFSTLIHSGRPLSALSLEGVPNNM